MAPSEQPRRVFHLGFHHALPQAREETMFVPKGIAVIALTLFLADATKTTTTNSPAKPASFKLEAVEEKVIEQTNAERARHGLPPLAVDQRLVQSARAHTAWMTRARRLQHTSRPVTENIAMGQQSPQEAMRS